MTVVGVIAHNQDRTTTTAVSNSLEVLVEGPRVLFPGSYPCSSIFTITGPMKTLLLGFVIHLLAVPAFAQIHPETEEDDVNANPTLNVPINRRGDSSGMANPPVSSSMPVPPTFSENYRATPDTTTAPAVPTAPEAGFPGARAPIMTSDVIPANLAQLFERGYQGKITNCAIVDYRGRDQKCQFEVLVDRRLYPFHYSDMCSSNEVAAQIGCNYGNHKENIACVLNQAILVGHCK